MKTRMPPLGVVAVAWSLAACTGNLVVGSDAGDEAPAADSQAGSFPDGGLDARASDSGALGPDAPVESEDATAMPLDAVTPQDAQPLEDAMVFPQPDAAPDDAPPSDASLPPVDAAPDAQCVPAVEVCNGADDDCDGMTDEGLGSQTCGVGACAVTVPVCSNGAPVPCEPPAGAAEACNGVDDDCNGMTDEGLGSDSCGVGACARIQPRCVDGVARPCVPGAPTTEVCNGIDDDCDGIVDDGCPAGINVSATTRTSPLTGGTGGTLQTLECPTGQVAIGVYGRSGTALDRIGLDCGTPGVVENRGTYPFTYTFDIAPSGLSSPPAGGLGGNSFGWDVSSRDGALFGMQIYYTTIVTNFIAEWGQHVLQGSIGSWTVGAGTTSGISPGFGSTTGTSYRWGCPGVDEAIGGLTVRAGTQIDAISVLCRRMTVRMR